MPHAKLPQYESLVAARKACTRCTTKDFLNPSAPSLSRWDSDQMGPWTRWLGDLDARVMVVGQEWGDTRAFKKQKGWDLASSATNRRLRELLRTAGVEVPDVSEERGDSGVFLTNAALCLKRGGCQAPVRDEWFSNCGAAFLRPQIELVSPRVVVTLGERAYSAVTEAFGIPRLRFRDAVDGAPVRLPNGSVLVPVYHCGMRIRNTHRRDPQQLTDWVRVRQALEG
ncbi:MAG: uracil-DNA glycosylase family protein [Gemmatimonadetes bacterium]|nr:uracil-DNA glycosylase family protein [Gemmatimonadota bacterium]